MWAPTAEYLLQQKSICRRADGYFVYFELSEDPPAMWLATGSIPVEGIPAVKQRTETRVPLTPEQADRVLEWLK